LSSYEILRSAQNDMRRRALNDITVFYRFFQMEKEKLVEVYIAKDITQAYLIKSLLEESGIFVQIVGDTLQVAMGELPLGVPTAPRIWVFESDADAAKEIIQKRDTNKNNT